MQPVEQDPRWQPVEDLLAGHAARQPDRAAVVDVDRGQGISFAQLARLVDGVALQLRDLGVGPGQRIALVIDAGIETIAVWLAVWRLGAMLCPFDISQIGAASTQAAFDTLKPALVLHGRRISAGDIPAGVGPCAQFGGWPATAGETVAIRMEPAAAATALHGLGAQRHDLAAACCTSGSTGRMKIVLHDHASYWLNGIASTRLLDLRADDRTLEYRSLSWYSPQILSLMPFLQLGTTLHMARQFSRVRFPEWIAGHGITVSVGVPTVLNILLTGPTEDLRRKAGGLRVMSSSSAPLAASTWRQFQQATGIPVVALYGSSEGGWICGNRLDDCRVGTVGRPAPGIALDIVDRAGASCPPGEAGEVVIEGGKLAVGFLQDDGSVRPIRGTRFHTHDLAVRDPDGFVRLLGRMDDVIIRGGIKISPGEIEDAVLAHPGVAEAAAVGVPDAIYGQEAVCFVVPRAGAALDGDSVRAQVAGLLPREKRPKAVFVIDALPRNARGKLRRDALQARWLDLSQEPEGH